MSNLENIIYSFVKTKLSDFRLPENFHDLGVDVYETEYGNICNLTYLMKKPFSRDDSDVIQQISKSFKKDIQEYFSHHFNGGIQSSVSTIDSYSQHKDWYNSKKQK
jgi:hypothetical protein